MASGTTQVRLLVSVSGPEFNWIPGQVVDMPVVEAAKWADGVRGEYVSDVAPSAPVDEQPDDAPAEEDTVQDDERDDQVVDEQRAPRRDEIETTEAQPVVETTSTRSRGGRRASKK